jgi:hypothetical protein
MLLSFVKVHGCDVCSSHILSLIASGILSLRSLPVALATSISSREIGGDGENNGEDRGNVGEVIDGGDVVEALE